MTINERVKQIRKEKKMTLEEFASKLNVTKVAISNIENGNRNLTDRMLQDICRVYNVNEYWLRTGNGEMFEEKTDAEEIMRFAMEVIGGNPNSTQATFIKALAKLTPAEWEVIQKIIDNLTENKKWPDESDPE